MEGDEEMKKQEHEDHGRHEDREGQEAGTDGGDHEGSRLHEGHEERENREGSRLHEGHEETRNHEGSRFHEGQEAGTDGRKHVGVRVHEGHEETRSHEGSRVHEGDEEAIGHEGLGEGDEHEFLTAPRWGVRAWTSLSPREEQVITRTIGCAIAVHRELGPGFLESIYKKAMRIELEEEGIPYEAERPICVRYRGIEIPGQRVDLIVDGMIVVELKSVVRFDSVHVAQVISYLKTTGLRAGLLINFRAPLLRLGLRRVVL
jgi:GxxExxY protein